MATGEAEDLNLHVSLCEERYRSLENRLQTVEQRLTKVETEILAVKVQQEAGFHGLRLLIEQTNNRAFRQIIASSAAIIVALISLLGYIVSR